MNRILWNRRPVNDSDGGDIDEIVLHNAIVHIEQMDDNCWWIGITTPEGYWAGNFTTKRAPMRFSQQECEGDLWQDNDTHEVAT